MNKKKFLIGCFATVLLFSVQKISAQSKSDSAEIKFETLSYDFGTIPKAGNTTYLFKFTNAGKSPLIISECRRVCGCTTPHCPSEAILPGKTSFVEVHYDSLRVGPFTKTVTVVSNAKNNVVELKITGNIIEEAGIPKDENKNTLKPKE